MPTKNEKNNKEILNEKVTKNKGKIARHGFTYLGLHVLQVSLDGGGLGNQLPVLVLVSCDTLLQLGDQSFRLLPLVLVLLSLHLQRAQLFPQRLYFLQHVCVAHLYKTIFEFYIPIIFST